MDEVLLVPEASGCVLDPLDLRVNGFAARVCDAVSEIRDDVLEPSLEHPRHPNDRLEPTPYRPSMPPAEMFPRRPFIDVLV